LEWLRVTGTGTDAVGTDAVIVADTGTVAVGRSLLRKFNEIVREKTALCLTSVKHLSFPPLRKWFS